MRKAIVFLLVFILLFSSIASFAAPGDIIHTGLKKVYRDGDVQALIDDIINGHDINKFYRELADGSYVNIKAEENEHLSYLKGLVENPSNNIKSQDDLDRYLVENGIRVSNDLKDITDRLATSFDRIPNVGDKEEYLGVSEAPRLKVSDHYTTPIPGSGYSTTKITRLTRPTGIGATKWLIKVVDSPTYLKLNDTLEGGNSYIQGKDIEVGMGKYLLLCATDSSNKVKAYASIAITADMFKAPRVVVDEDDTITATFEPSGNKSGATIISGLPAGAWKIAVLDTPVSTVYVDSKFVGSVDAGMDLVLASEAELDNMTDDFKKDIIIYSEKDGKIERYKIFSVNKGGISGVLDAKPLDDAITPDGPITIGKGNTSGTTKITGLVLPTGATKWMYALVDNDTVIPKRDRVFAGSTGYEVGQDIPVNIGNHLMVLATDDGGKVRAFGIVTLKDTMIKEPLADKIVEFTHYSMPEKGTNVGTTKFQFLNYDGATLYYELSNKPIAIPGMNSDLPSHINDDYKITPNADGLADNVKVFEPGDAKLKDENGFTIYMMLYAVKDGKVIAATRESFIMTPYSIRLPNAGTLPWKNYKASETDPDADSVKPGSSSNTTILKKLNKDGIAGAENLKYIYTIVSNETTPGINEIVKLTKPLEAGKDLSPANVGNYLLILLVDSANRTKYYVNIPLTATNIRTSDASLLIGGRNYSNPVPGTEFGSTKFNLLGLDGIEGATQFMVATSNVTFRPVELNSTVTGAVKYATVIDGVVSYENVNGNILGVDIKDNRFLLLLATDGGGKVKGYQRFTLTETMIRGNKAKPLTSINYTIGVGTKPGTIKFNKLSPFNIGNTSWMYKWAETDVFSANPPFEGQIITGANVIRTKAIDQYTVEGLDDIKVGAEPSYGHILLLAMNGNRAVGYKVIPVTSDVVQTTAEVLKIDLIPGSTPDSTKINGTDASRAKKYIVSTTPFVEEPGPNTDLPRTGVKDVPASQEISVRTEEYLRIFDVDASNKIIGYKDITIELKHIKQGTAKLEVLTHDGKNDDVYEILEGRVKANAIKIKVELTDAKWADVINDRTIKDIFLNGFKADGTEQAEWGKVVQKIKDGRFSISKSGEILTITTTATEDFNISKDQKISLTIPARAIVGAINAIEAKGHIVIKPTIDANISGSVVNNIRQSTINSGNATILIDIVDSKWDDNIETVENKKALLDGFSGDGDTDSPWSKETDGLKALIVADLDSIKLIDPQKISITIPKNTVAINSPETITLTIPESLVDDAKSPIIAAPSFTIYPDILPIGASVDDSKEVILEAPKYLNALKDNDTWIVKLDEKINFKDDFSIAKDISTSTLPSGLKLEITKLDNKQLSIKLVGKTTKELSDGTINLVIKASAIDQKNYSDSKTIPLEYKQGGKIDLDGVTYRIDSSIDNIGIYLVMDDSIRDSLQYSKNATSASNGDWATIPVIPVENKISGNLEPITISVKETKQTDNFKIVGKLVNPSAPTGIVIDEYSYNGTELTVTLNEHLGLEYNLTTPNEWKDVPDTKKITFTNKNSILVVRKKALTGTGEGGSLPSLPTPKLNGLYLGDVHLDVSQSKIIGATKDMKYKLSSDGTWNAISVNDPVVDFKEGNQVWISEAKNENNKKDLGTVSQAKMDPADIDLIKKLLADETHPDGIYYHIGDKKITNKTGINLQYNITKGEVPAGAWINLGIGTTVKNVNFIPGNVFVRKIVDSNSLPSNPVKILEIAEPIAPPKIEVNDDSKTLRYEASGGTYELLDESFEYKINTGEYQNGNFLATDPKRLGNATIYVKRKATKELLASKEVNFKFTENISLANVKVNVAEGVIEGTTTKMEYRTDESKDAPNSPWKTASTTKTSINMYEGMNIWVRELGKPSTSKPLLENLIKMASPDKSVLEYNIAQKFIKNKFTNILEYRINDGNWSTINVDQTIGIEFVPTRLSIRTKATVDKLASDVVDVIDSLAYPDVAPEVVSSDTDNKINSIDGVDSTGWGVYEFKLKTDSEWMPGSILKDYDLSGDKIVHIRKKGASNKLPSEIAEVVFTKNIYLTKVELRETTPLKLLYTEPEMEYQVYLKGKPLPTTWTKATAGTTTLDSAIKFNDILIIAIRDSRNKTDITVLVDTEDKLPVDLSGVSYKIESSGVVFTGINNRMKYKLSSSAEWKDGTGTGDGDNVNTGSLEIMEITIEDNLYPSVTRTIAVNERVETPKVTVSKVDYIKSEITLDGFDKDNMQYSIDGGENWKHDADDNIFVITKGDILVVRANAEAGIAGVGKLPSLPTKQLNGTSLVDVTVDIQNKKLLNTAKSMEYSLNSTDGKDGTWKPASTSNNETTGVQLELGTIIWIREIGNTGNSRKIGPIGQEPMPDLTSGVTFDISAGRIENTTDQDLEYRVVGGSWKPINEILGASKVAYNVVFKPGPLEFRKAANGSNTASKPATLTVIKEYGSKPQIEYNDIRDTVTIPAGEDWKDYEYKITIDGISSSWITGEELEKEDLSGKKKVEIRKKATPKDLPSEIQDISFTDNLIKRVGLSTHVKPFELNGTTAQMQYRINGGTWRDCSKDTNVTKLIRADGSDLTDLSVVNIIEVCEMGNQAHTVIVYEK